ncbi:hypothetical protein Q4577_04375 [Marinovum sp. 2_MG-2023]|uniref:glycosyl hydrolase-related protein n=1 Tax=unclassified Marinovum TaxID=2647166 RepID=UPI0026E2BF1C|nr:MULTISPECIES: glycosyl hydrolase-related protein [unclassified Marinovum]MDO6729242.1 hypothetical protein [Marinovum sp. 2_MG-2023]MDO6779131.1 hypothetical protein [Marinovum sp. 1_MG-2023]
MPTLGRTIYEAGRCRGPVIVTFPQGVSDVLVCDLPEQEIVQLEVVDRSVVVPLKPFEIVSLRCCPKEVTT